MAEDVPLDMDGMDFDLTEAMPDEKEAAYDLYFGGYAESRTQVGVDRGEVLSFRQRLHLETSAEMHSLLFFGSADADFDPAVAQWSDQQEEQTHARVDKLYLSLDTSYLDLVAGQQVVRWGTGDGINPMDLFNPVDQRDPVANARSLRRRSVPLLQAVVQRPGITLEGVFLPMAEVNKPPLTDSPWEPAGVRAIRQAVDNGQAELEDENTPDGQEYGVRATVTASGWDLSLLYYEGYANDAVYSREQAGGIITYKALHPHFTAYGFNFAKGLSSGTVRGEVAYKPDTVFPAAPHNTAEYEAGGDGLVKADFVQAVVGLDWTFFSNLYLNGQYFVEVLPGSDSGAACRDFSDGMTFKVSDKFLDTALETGVQGTVYFNGGGLSTEAYVQYEVDDHWELTGGVILWEGDADSILGQFRDNDMIYCKVKYSF